MTYGNPPTVPVGVGETASFIMEDGSVAHIRGIEQDRWHIFTDAMNGEILRDGDMYRTRTQIESSIFTAVAPDWTSIFTHIYR